MSESKPRLSSRSFTFYSTLPIVVVNLFNENKRTYACLAKIVALNKVDYVVHDYYHGGKIEVRFSEYDVIPVYLSASQRRFVMRSLRLQGLKPHDYIIPVTVHGTWKHAWWQGYVFSLSEWIIDTGKHIVTRGEEAEKFVDEIIRKLTSASSSPPPTP